MQVRPEWDESSRRLALRFPDGELVEGVAQPGDPVEASMYGEAHPSRAVDGPWAAALSEFVGAPLTLLWSESGAADRSTSAGWMSLVSQASLARLGQQAGEHRPVDGRRFRMLFEIDGVGPHQEDLWIGERVRIGGATVSAGRRRRALRGHQVRPGYRRLRPRHPGRARKLPAGGPHRAAAARRLR